MSRSKSGKISICLKKQKALSHLDVETDEVTKENYGLWFCCFELL